MNHLKLCMIDVILQTNEPPKAMHDLYMIMINESLEAMHELYILMNLLKLCMSHNIVYNLKSQALKQLII